MSDTGDAAPARTAPWRYDAPGDGHTPGARRASVDSVAPLAIAGVLGHPRLELVEDPGWGPRVHLRLHAGELAAGTGLRVGAAIDALPPFDVPVSRPEGVPSLLSLREPRRLFDAIAGATLLHLRVPLRGVAPVRIAFAVAGLDLARLQVRKPPA